MIETVRNQVVSALITAAIFASVAALWQRVTDGGLIRFLGGVTAQDYTTLESDVREVAAEIAAIDGRFENLELLVVRGPYQGGDPDSCPEGWIDNDARFQDSNMTVRGGGGSQYRLCIRAAR